MGSTTLVLVIVIGAALAFDFTNGFHDTANAMATSIATGALKPLVAVLISAALNFIGAFISISVANHDCQGDHCLRPATSGIRWAVRALRQPLIRRDDLEPHHAGSFTIPSSSSHALIGGLIGAAIASEGSSRRERPRDHARRSSLAGILAISKDRSGEDERG